MTICVLEQSCILNCSKYRLSLPAILLRNVILKSLYNSHFISNVRYYPTSVSYCTHNAIFSEHVEALVFSSLCVSYSVSCHCEFCAVAS